MICKSCYSRFSEPKSIRTSYEDYYGIEGRGRTYLHLEVCPYCGDDAIDEEEEED